MRDMLEILGEILLIWLVIVLIIAIVSIPFIRLSYKAEIGRYNAFKQSLENARLEDMSEAERATILIKIADWNMDIAKTRYWNRTIFGIYIPDEVTELEPIK